MNSKTTFIKRCAGKFFQATLWFSVAFGFLWAIGAVYYLTYLPRIVATVLAMGLVGGAGYWAKTTTEPRKWRQKLAACCAVVYIATLPQQPSNQRNWAADNQQLAVVEKEGDRARIVNFRSNEYRSETDFDVHYGDLNFDVSSLKQVWFIVQRFTALEGIAHNFLTFEYTKNSKPAYFSVSVEIRRETDEAFSPVRGLYRQYELIYVVSTEQDEIGMRTVLRPDDRVYMYKVNADSQQVQQLFLDVADRINKLKETPEFYHSLLNNCTNNIVTHTYQLTPEPINWLDPRIVAPGYADRFAFANGLIGDPSESFEALRVRSRIDEVARKAGITPDFSANIRRLSAKPQP